MMISLIVITGFPFLGLFGVIGTNQCYVLEVSKLTKLSCVIVPCVVFDKKLLSLVP